MYNVFKFREAVELLKNNVIFTPDREVFDAVSGSLFHPFPSFATRRAPGEPNTRKVSGIFSFLFIHKLLKNYNHGTR